MPTVLVERDSTVPGDQVLHAQDGAMHRRVLERERVLLPISIDVGDVRLAAIGYQRPVGALVAQAGLLALADSDGMLWKLARKVGNVRL